MLRLTLRIIIGHKLRQGKKFRKIMKNVAKKGKSARHGNRPSPYTKYNKKPYEYSSWVRHGGAMPSYIRPLYEPERDSYIEKPRKRA